VNRNWKKRKTYLAAEGKKEPASQNPRDGEKNLRAFFATLNTTRGEEVNANPGSRRARKFSKDASGA